MLNDETSFFFGSDGPGFMFNAMFTIVPLFIILIIVFGIIGSVRLWSKNNKQPILDVKARIVSKRTSVTHHHSHVDDHHHHHDSTSYYVTFEVESGDRIEFHISGIEYGMLSEGDLGVLRFQGTRYLQFTRQSYMESY